MPKMIYSFSRLSLFEECPLRFYWRYVEEREEPESEPLAFGSAIHQAIESVLKGQNIQDALFEAEMDSPLPLNSGELKKLVERAIKVGNKIGENVKIEEYFELPLSDKPHSPKVRGYIDYIEFIFGTIDFLDWKSNRRKYNPTNTMQLPLYAWALSKIYKVEHISGTLYFLRFFKEAKKRMTFSKNDMEQARAWAEKIANEIEKKLTEMEAGHEVNTLFPFKPNPHCKHCSFAAECLLKNEKNHNWRFVV